MKLMLGNTPVKKMMIHNDTQDATMVASDLQAGVTCYAKGQKVTGTGKSFEFAQYGKINTNVSIYCPVIINVIEISSLDYPIKMSVALPDMHALDFSIVQTIGHVIVDNIEYPITAQVNGVILKLACEKTVALQVFYGKDNYI